MKSFSFKILLATVVFSLLVFFNYSEAQKSLKNTKPSTLGVSVVGSVPKAKIDTPTPFSWKVEAPSDFQTNYTTIFYGYTSTPSALTNYDAPDAAGYQYKAQDYLLGTYFLPYQFSASITFPKVGRVWYRGYAKVRGDHLWTNENYLDITP